LSTNEDEEEDEMETLSLALQSCLFEDDEHKIKHSASEPVINKDKPKTLINDEWNDDDEIWCNKEDEDNLEYRVKLDHEKEEQLRQILGDVTLEIVREALKV
jgi:hypothetical protein